MEPAERSWEWHNQRPTFSKSITAFLKPLPCTHVSFQANEKCHIHAEAEERARKLQSELHAKLNSQIEAARLLEERLQKSNEEEAILQTQIEQLQTQNAQERENVRRAQQRANVNTNKSTLYELTNFPAHYIL